jgi:hypothetical protein
MDVELRSKFKADQPHWLDSSLRPARFIGFAAATPG